MNRSKQLSRFAAIALSSLTALGTPALSSAAPEPFTCPTMLGQTDQKALVENPGWQALVIQPDVTKHELTAFQINWGSVETPDGAIYDQQVEKPDGRKGSTLTLSWDVHDIQKGYAICGYAFTNVRLVRPLKGYTRCTAVNRRSSKDAAYRFESAGCR
ncbi:STY0301 family protein [Roseateles amylovorans]|uniref:Uncharacterized protein n=1 Tax=Roseateles amylovorans TaxID=2978473 RepID=A0ABY6AWH0_9BURK|nr:STY0301 family protein [Roseateles amylovorans]UXH76749.1 hypothetical protein N4261_17125 [Roseateles amylovorans]